MKVSDVIAALSALPQDLELVIWDDDKSHYVGVTKPQAVKLATNLFDELVDDREPGDPTHVTIGLDC